MKSLYIVGRYVWYFLIYSLLGAGIETVYRLITEHHLYGIHGFLHLPLFPIYGIGALLIITLLKPHVHHIVTLFVLGVVLTTALEFIAHFLIEVIFGIRIWDYSQVPFNLYGRVSLYTSIGFGLAAVALVHVIHPRLEKLFKRLPNRVNIVIAVIVFTMLLTDIVTSIIQRLGN